MAGRLAARPFWEYTKKLTFMNRCCLIWNWPQECRANHTNCTAGPGIDIKLPVRLIDISQSLGDISIRLVSVTGLDSSRYVALSHCWGDPSLVPSTMRAKATEFNRHVNTGALPPIFRDAVCITHAINVRYLWIDSLCIVQDGPDEWARKAAKWASIFQNAYLTLSAAGARSCKEGCGLSTQFSPAVHVGFPSATKVNSKDSQIAAGLQQLCVRRRGWRKVHDHYLAVRQFPIYSRGWIFQKTLLSRRATIIRPFHGAHGAENWQIAYDSGEVGTHVSPVNLYFLLLRVGKIMNQFTFFQLLIEPCGRQQHTYRRVGYLETSYVTQDDEMSSALILGDMEFPTNEEIITYELLELDQEVVRLI